MAPASLAAQKITSSSRLPSGLANDPPPSASLKKTKLAGAAAISSRLGSNPPPMGTGRKSVSLINSSSARLPSGLLNDPPPSPVLKKTAVAGAAAISSRLKANPPPLGPSRKSSSYNFKHTDPPGTSLLTAYQPLVAPLALSPDPPGIPPGTPLLHAAAASYTPPVPPNLDISDIVQPVPVRPKIREGSSYSHSVVSPLPPIDEHKVFIPGKDKGSPGRVVKKRRGSGFFATYNMDGAEELPILGRRRTNSGSYDEGWPLPLSPPTAAHVVERGLVERGLNTPGDPRRSSMIAEGDLEPALAGEVVISGNVDPVIVMQSGVAAMIARDGAPVIDEQGLRDRSGASAAKPTSASTSKSSSYTSFSRLSAPLESSQTSLSRVEEEPSNISTDTKFFDFSPSFNAASRKPSENDDTSPHTRHNTPGPEAGPSRPEVHPLTPSELDGLEDAREVDEETDHEDWHSIRSHMTRKTTADANSLLYNTSIATPNMALPTPEELQAEFEKKEQDKRLYLENVAAAFERHSSDSSGIAGPASPTPGTVMAHLGKIKSANPFPRSNSNKKDKGKGKGKEKAGERPTTSNFQRGLSDMFKGNERKARERRERESQARVERHVEECHNRKVDHGLFSGESSGSENVLKEYKSPWVQADEEDGGPYVEWQREERDDGNREGDPFHDNFATSDAASEILSLSSSMINFLQNDDGSYPEIKGRSALMLKSQRKGLLPNLDDLPGIRRGKHPVMSPALARLASGSRRTRGMVNVGKDGRPIVRRELIAVEQRVSSDSESGGEEEVQADFQIMRDAGVNAQAKRGNPRAKRFMRPGLQSRLSTVRDLDIRRASTVEMVRSGATTSRIVVQETRNSHDSVDEDERERVAREARLKYLTRRERSWGSFGRKKSVSPVKRRKGSDESSMRRRISTALQGGFGGRKMTTDGTGGIGTLADLRARERQGIFATILDKFRRGSEDDAIAERRRGGKPAAGMMGHMTGDAGVLVGEGEPMAQKTTSFWKRRIEADPLTGKLPVLKRMQEAIKRNSSSAMPVPPAAA